MLRRALVLVLFAACSAPVEPPDAGQAGGGASGGSAGGTSGGSAGGAAGGSAGGASGGAAGGSAGGTAGGSSTDAGRPDAGAPDAGPTGCTGRVCGPAGDGGTCGVCVAGSFCSSQGQCRAGVLEWAGLEWNVRGFTVGGPGPNRWDSRNVELDAMGNLHLTIQQRAGEWTCASLGSTRSLGFGEYEWWVDSALDRLDRNVVLGLFTYPPPSVGPDTTNEIDIEMARWGSSANPPLNYNVWPVLDALGATGRAFPMNLVGTYTTHRFDWRSSRIDFGSFHGFRSDTQNPIATWSFAPVDFNDRVPQAPVPVNMNLWLFQGRPPSDDAGVEVVLRAFRHP